MRALLNSIRLSISIAAIVGGLGLLSLGISGMVAPAPSPKPIDARCLEPGREYLCPGEGSRSGISISFATPTPPVSLPDPSVTPISVETTAGAIGRMIAAKAGIDAPIVVKGIDAQGVMEAPDTPYEIAWYDFTRLPGQGGNAVFSGHVDWYPNIKGVFWGLRSLKKGDIIRIVLADNREYSYRVIESYLVDADSAAVADIVGDTGSEVITLITCDGTFIRNSQGEGEYLGRRIVRAERIFT